MLDPHFRQLGYSHVDPDEIDNGLDHLDGLETQAASAKDRMFSAGYTGNEGLRKAKLSVGY